MFPVASAVMIIIIRGIRPCCMDCIHHILTDSLFVLIFQAGLISLVLQQEIGLLLWRDHDATEIRLRWTLWQGQRNG